MRAHRTLVGLAVQRVALGEEVRVCAPPAGEAAGRCRCAAGANRPIGVSGGDCKRGLARQFRSRSPEKRVLEVLLVTECGCYIDVLGFFNSRHLLIRRREEGGLHDWVGFSSNYFWQRPASTRGRAR